MNMSQVISIDSEKSNTLACMNSYSAEYYTHLIIYTMEL